ncbi:lytic transglycosylase domain-containing protein [Pusillimonas sp. ANT_WB101]|uniref:lytic transglycosylase domain-containing protein n=1 Tax=Pusillimonas sp. ANT_WB101 TaxID=2597356 RepID=UPI002105D97B|nr:lytic transglycosylase domain-containing protein [Pusillimonas sp. ANT_WB101]
MLLATISACTGAERTASRANASSTDAGAQPAVAKALKQTDLRHGLAPLDTADVVQVASLQGAMPNLAAGVRGLDTPTGPGTVTLVAPERARQALIQAREARQKKDWVALDAQLPEARADLLLGAYAEYWKLYQALQDNSQLTPEGQIRAFIQKHHGTYLGDRLQGDWLVVATRAGNYSLAASLGPLINTDATEKCSLLHAMHMTGQPVSASQALDAFKPVQACWVMLNQLSKSQVVGWDDIEPQLRAIVETNKTAVARRMASILFTPAEMTQYSAMMKSPKNWLSGRGAPATRAETEITTIALSRLAYGDQRDANAAYVESQWASRLPQQNIEWVWSQFGLIAALNLDPNAARWYRRSGTLPLTDYSHAWQVRSELRQPSIDWARVASAIQRMSDRQAAEPVWVYWAGRADAARGDQASANKRYASIADELDFYGQLATDELGKTPSLPPRPEPVTAAEIKQARNNPGLRRAVELFHLGWRPEAVPEWVFAVRGLNDRQLRAAAELAREEHIYDRVVNTSLLTRDEVDFSQRFIAPFEGKVAQKAHEINLDPAWVYGLIRQESRFITDARSHVGASGLMQLMPATARWVANKIGMSDFRPSSVNDFDTNTILGTNYLSMVLNNLSGNEVLATAGYNAGPGRSISWRSTLSAPVEGAVFAETIPFTETRLYVKNVMSNTIYYSMMFTGKPQSLKQRLGTVTPAPGRQASLP